MRILSVTSLSIVSKTKLVAQKFKCSAPSIKLTPRFQWFPLLIGINEQACLDIAKQSEKATGKLEGSGIKEQFPKYYNRIIQDMTMYSRFFDLAREANSSYIYSTLNQWSIFLPED
jgi:hypothetical protein